MTLKTIVLTAGSSWPVPADWNDSSNEVYLIGPGGTGAAGSTTSSQGGGPGGGGASAVGVNLALIPGARVPIQIPSGGAQLPTWFGSITTLLADYGRNGTLTAAGMGGQAANSVGYLCFSGGNGGAIGAGTFGGGGGGGAAGPNGAGAAGGNALTNATSGTAGGGGGGGADGGTAGANNTTGNPANGVGGQNRSGSGGGTGSGGAGSSGGGGAGGNGGIGTFDPGGAGSTEALWTVSGTGYGPGSGGGGGGAYDSNGRPGGAGGTYGGGGGGGSGCASNPSAGTNSAAGQGLIVITYTPASSVQPPIFPAVNGLGWPLSKTPNFATASALHASGLRIRRQRRLYPIWDFTLTFEALDSAGLYPGATAESLQAVMGFFNGSAGSFASFLIQDPSDYAVTAGPIGTGDGSTINFTLTRILNGTAPELAEPVGYVTAGSLTAVWINGTLQNASTYTLLAPNILSFNTAPSAGAVITASFTFYFVVTFADDKLDFSEIMYNLWELKECQLKSVIAPGLL